ncbi:FAD/NAD(P)-binding domain-containing protein [Hypoxylon rubiginosum]|uniref:FAD/NAD(P)-binding domain-containing protein n=1 Tax=Hypoxylon rubiginosum TaxID=110542 RepID=A0ACB9YPB5_9PEZI|nr:FAD/NAD(P)-binding domain-containing protein [Hypoxylon rubiginosum]
MSGLADNHHVNSAAEGSKKAEARNNAQISIAIVGGGVVGVVLALGLLHRGVQVVLYERASNFHDVGAGIAFTEVARKCMFLLNPAILESMKRVGVPQKNPFDEYWDGYHHTGGYALKTANNNIGDPEGTSSRLLFKRYNRQLAFWGCLRAQFVEDLSRALPPGVVHFNKELVDYSDSPSSKSVTLRFADGSVSTADALIGCDGLRSRVRAQLLAAEAPLAVNPTYAHKRCYRTVVPTSDGERVLGTRKANDQCMHVGPGAHIVTYPVGERMLNVVVFLADDGDWPDLDRSTKAPGRREDVLRALEGWGPAARGLAALLPPRELTVWGIFDMCEHPAPYYARGRVCLAGDAAHASAPYHGAGAGFGIEDALVLATALEEVLETLNGAEGGEKSKAEAIGTAFQAFNQVRYARTQWLVRSSRETGDIFEWRYPGTGMDSAKCLAELDERFKVIWDFDVDGMIEESRAVYHRLLAGKGIS